MGRPANRGDALFLWPSAQDCRRTRSGCRNGRLARWPTSRPNADCGKGGSLWSPQLRLGMYFGEPFRRDLECGAKQPCCVPRTSILCYRFPEGPACRAWKGGCPNIRSVYLPRAVPGRSVATLGRGALAQVGSTMRHIYYATTLRSSLPFGRRQPFEKRMPRSSNSPWSHRIFSGSKSVARCIVGKRTVVTK